MITRMRVNKYCLEYSSQWARLKKDNAQYIDYIRENPYHRVHGGICPQCGTELYADWFYNKISSITYSKTTVGFGTNQIEAIPYPKKAELEKLLAHLKEQDSLGEEEEKTFTQRDGGATCPVCAAKTELCGFSHYDRTPDAALKEAYEALRFRHELQYRNRMRGIFDAHPIPAYSPVCAAGFDRDNPEQLKSYLYHLICLESNILSLKKKLKDLSDAQFMNQIAVNRVDYAPMVAALAVRQALAAQYDAARLDYSRQADEADRLRKQYPRPVVLPEPPMPQAPQYLEAGLFNKKKIAEQNAALEADYNRRLNQYYALCHQRQEEMDRQNRARAEQHRAKIAAAEESLALQRQALDELHAQLHNFSVKQAPEICPQRAQQQLLAEEVRQAEQLLTQTLQARNQLYSANIIFGKYRELVALATFYEYLMAGRCASLEGAAGAYNLYESEIRSNLIIAKLSDIEKSLKKISQSQYMICDQLTQMNRTLEHMRDTMEAAYSAIQTIQTNTTQMSEYMSCIAQNSDVIAHNSAVTAYYSKVNAELTNALGFMVALK